MTCLVTNNFERDCAMKEYLLNTLVRIYNHSTV